MRKLRVITATLLAALFAVTFAAACAPEASKDLVLNPSSVELTEGESQQFKVLEGETELQATDLTWTTSNKDVATVTSRGRVTAQGEGTAEITATHEDGRSAKATVTVNAKEAVTITLKKEDGTALGETATVKRDADLVVVAEVSSGATVTWASSDSGKATVTPDATNKNKATIHGVYPTSADLPVTITASAGGSSAKVNVTVEDVAVGGSYTMDWIEESNVYGKTENFNKWWYWNSKEASWAGVVVNVARAEYRNEKMTVEYSNNTGAFYGIQIFYQSSNTTAGKNYKLTFTMNSTAAGQVSLNGSTLDVQSGTHEYTLYYVQSATMASFSLKMGVEGAANITDATVEISNVSWTEYTPKTLNTPTALAISGKTVTITDTNDAANISGYRLLFKQNGKTLAAATVSGKTGGTFEDYYMKDGSYDVHVMALGKGEYGTSAESGKLATYVVNNGGINYPVTKGGADAALETPGTWHFREEWENAGFQNAKVENGVLSFHYLGSGNWDSYQLYYKNPELETGKKYNFTMKFTCTMDPGITLAAGQKILISGEEHTLVNGANTFTAQFTETNGYSIQILFDVWHGVEGEAYGGAGRLGACTFTITEMTWTEVVPEPGTIVSGDEASATDHWVYWNDQGYEPNYSWVTVQEAKYTKNGDGSFDVTAKFSSDNENVCAFGFQLFYNDPAYQAGKSYTLTLTAKASNDCEIAFNGESHKSFKANVEQQISVTFTLGSGLSLFDMQLQPKANTAYELTLTNIKWTAN